jgi:hypothetical protein
MVEVSLDGNMLRNWVLNMQIVKSKLDSCSSSQIPVMGFREHDNETFFPIIEFTFFTICLPGVLSLRVKRPDREADHSPPSSAEFKNVWNHTSTHSISLHGVLLS